MKKKYKIIFVFFLFLLFVFISLKIFFKQKFYYFKIENKKYKLLTATNPLQWQKGLMNYRKKSELNGADGMIFIFPQRQFLTFWNKNTYLDLNVYWIEDEKIIGKSFLPSIEKTKEIFTIQSPKPVNKVIEIIIDSNGDK